MRYGLMVDEAGVVVDDGVVARLGPRASSTSPRRPRNSATLYRELSRWNTLWRLDCGLVNLTGAVAAINLAGPRARAVLGAVSDLDVSETAFPFLAVKRGKGGGGAGACHARRLRRRGGVRDARTRRSGARRSGMRSGRQVESTASGLSVSKPSVCCGSRRGTSSSARTPTVSRIHSKPASGGRSGCRNPSSSASAASRS